MTSNDDNDTFGWHYRGGQRPPFAFVPEFGQESVWDYPRPPAIEPSDRRVEVRLNDRVIASTRTAFRVLETARADLVSAAAGSGFRCADRGRRAELL